MVKGDTKRHLGRGGWGSGGYSDYDDEGRGKSKAEYDAFVAQWATTGYDCKYLLDPERFTNEELYRLWKNSTYRYNKDDWSDRVRELVEKKCSETVWLKLSKERLQEAKDWNKERYWMMNIAYKIINFAYDREQEAREAVKLQQMEEESVALRQQAELTVGLLRSDFHEALTYREKYNQSEGDWLDDPVSAYAGYGGFGEEVRHSVGVKLQITVSLDISNSMINNHIAEPALQIFKELYLSMQIMQQENEGDVFTAAFLFSGAKSGKEAIELSNYRNYGYYGNVSLDKTNPQHLGELESLRDVSTHWLFDGEDTWMYPLFEKIEKWENKNSDPGAIRLDLIISDAALEHPKDLRESGIIQERRDGALQTVILNIIPEKDWHGSALPRRCIQYPANVENLGGMMRNLISEFVSIQ